MNGLKTLVSTIFLGMPLVAWGGLITLTLLIVQMLIGLRLVRVDFKYHTYMGWTLFVVAIFHGLAALIYIFG